MRREFGRMTKVNAKGSFLANVWNVPLPLSTWLFSFQISDCIINVNNEHTLQIPDSNTPIVHYNVKIEIACTLGNWHLNDGKSLIFVRFPWSSYSFPERKYYFHQRFPIDFAYVWTPNEYKAETMTTILRSYSFWWTKRRWLYFCKLFRNNCFPHIFQSLSIEYIEHRFN